jgi:hypothetical protein
VLETAAVRLWFASECEVVTQSQSHIETGGRSVSQSVCLGVEPKSGTFDQRFFLRYCLVFFGAPSLTRGRVCHVSVFVIEVYNSQPLFTTIYI